VPNSERLWARRARHSWELRFQLLASPERQDRLSARQQTALTTAWDLIRGSGVEEAIHLRNDLRAVLNTSAASIDCGRRGPSAFTPGPFGAENHCPTLPAPSLPPGSEPTWRRSWASSSATSSA
jgi:hypothetical protein